MDFKKKGYYVFSMPVTSLENQIRGTTIWGLPKVVEEIDIATDSDRCRTVARDAKDWARADELRDRILALGFVLEDGPDGTKIQPDR